MATEGHAVEVCCQVLEVSVPGYYAWQCRPPSARALRHAWLTDLIREIRTATRANLRQPTGACRVAGRPRHCGRARCGGDAHTPRPGSSALPPRGLTRGTTGPSGTTPTAPPPAPVAKRSSDYSSATSPEKSSPRSAEPSPTASVFHSTWHRGIDAMMESFWSRMQVELLDRQHWLTRIEQAGHADPDRV